MSAYTGGGARSQHLPAWVYVDDDHDDGDDDLIKNPHWFAVVKKKKPSKSVFMGNFYYRFLLDMGQTKAANVFSPLKTELVFFFDWASTGFIGFSDLCLALVAFHLAVIDCKEVLLVLLLLLVLIGFYLVKRNFNWILKVQMDCNYISVAIINTDSYWVLFLFREF